MHIKLLTDLGYQPPNFDKVLKEVAEDTDVGNEQGECVRRLKEQWVCGGLDKKWDNAKLNASAGKPSVFGPFANVSETVGVTASSCRFCFIGTGARTARPYRHSTPSSKRRIPALYLVSHVITKVLAEGLIDIPSYQRSAEPFFQHKINRPSIKV